MTQTSTTTQIPATLSLAYRVKALAAIRYGTATERAAGRRVLDHDASLADFQLITDRA